MTNRATCDCGAPVQNYGGWRRTAVYFFDPDKHLVEIRHYESA
ncbi:MAG: hypothetical protein ABSA49_10430 [Rhizomicrobium sp.]